MQHHYATYDEGHLKPIMQHIAKNVGTVNDGKTKFQVRKTGSIIRDVLLKTPDHCCAKFLLPPPSPFKQAVKNKQQVNEDQPDASP